MLRYRTSALLYAFLIMAATHVAAVETDAPAITWLVPDVPPVFVARGPFVRQGAGDITLTVLQQQLPGYQHRVRRVSMSTFTVLMHDTSNNVCTPLLPAMPRYADTTVVSQTLATMAPLRMITFRDMLATLPRKDGAVTLAETLRRSLRTVYLDGWSHEDVQPLLARASDQRNVLVLSDIASPENALELLMERQVDYLVGHGYLLHFARSKFGALADDLVLLPLAEALANTPVHVACLDNAWGRARIADIDRVLADPSVQADIARLLRHWYPAMDLSAEAQR